MLAIAIFDLPVMENNAIAFFQMTGILLSEIELKMVIICNSMLRLKKKLEM